MAVTNPSAATYTAPTKDANGNLIDSDPRLKVTGYEVVIRNASGQDVLTADTSLEVGAQQVTPLPQSLPAGTYQAAVRAKNSFGAGKLGAFQDYVVTPPLTVPEPPTNFSLA